MKICEYKDECRQDTNDCTYGSFPRKRLGEKERQKTLTHFDARSLTRTHTHTILLLIIRPSKQRGIRAKTHQMREAHLPTFGRSGTNTNRPLSRIHGLWQTPTISRNRVTPPLARVGAQGESNNNKKTKVLRKRDVL